MARTIIFVTLLVVLTGPGVSPSAAQANPDVIETGRLLAILLDSGRTEEQSRRVLERAEQAP